MKHARLLLPLLFVACASAPPADAPRIYIRAQTQDEAGNAAEVARALTQLDAIAWENGVNRADIRKTADDPAVRAAMAKLDARQAHVDNARVAFTIQGQRDLVPEGIAYDPVDDVFYLSSIYRRKVVRVDRNGVASDFVSEGQDGMLSGLGIKVDASRRLLWVISTGTAEMRNTTEADQKRSILAAYDLRDGHLVKKIEATPAQLNDLTLLSDGSLFATDMGRSKVMRLAPNADALEEWADGFGYPNGIAVSDDERVLYVADFHGVTRFTIADKTRTKIASHALLNGIDGLNFVDGTLVGIQNAIGAPRVIRIDPSNGDVEILESKNALFEIPLTGAVVGDEYWFIANPGLRSFDANHNIWPDEKLQDLVMLRLPLR